MGFPRFRWIGTINAETGTAFFQAGEHELTVDLPQFTDGHNIHVLMVKVFIAGYRQAKDDAKAAARDAIEMITP